MRARQSAEHAAEDRGDPLHALGILARGAQRLRRFAGRADPEADRRAVYEQPHQHDEDPGDIHEHRVPRKDLADERDLVDQRDRHVRQTRHEIARRAGKPEDLARKVRGDAEREGVQRAADDELVAFELDREQREEQPDQDAERDCRQHAHGGACAEIACDRGDERAHQDHAVHTDVHDARVLGHESAERRQRDRRGAPEHLCEGARRKDGCPDIMIIHARHLLPCAS